MGRPRLEPVERVDIPLSTAELILRRCQPGIDVAPKVMIANKALFLTPQLGWLEQVTINCYTQGMMDMWNIIEHHPDLLRLHEPDSDEHFHKGFE